MKNRINKTMKQKREDLKKKLWNIFFRQQRSIKRRSESSKQEERNVRPLDTLKPIRGGNQNQYEMLIGKPSPD
jgi:hypothetical protein